VRDTARQEKTDRSLSPSELVKLPAEKRDEILEAAAALAEEEYRTNRELTDFEAFGEDDPHAGFQEG
jgi:hypothetical protein